MLCSASIAGAHGKAGQDAGAEPSRGAAAWVGVPGGPGSSRPAQVGGAPVPALPVSRAHSINPGITAPIPVQPDHLALRIVHNEPAAQVSACRARAGQVPERASTAGSAASQPCVSPFTGDRCRLGPLGVPEHLRVRNRFRPTAAPPRRPSRARFHAVTSGDMVTRSGECGAACLIAMPSRLSDVDSARTPRSQWGTPNIQELHHGR
jgi:hypothetical protein